MEKVSNLYTKLQPVNRKMACTRRCQLSLLYGLSAFFLGLAIFIISGWERMYGSILFNALTLANNSQGYNTWKQTPIPMYLELYLFNWTNTEEVINSNFKIKPHFEECGPYVYQEVHTRVNIWWHTNSTITYQQKRTWLFLPELSGGSLNDSITNVNVIAVTVAYAIRNRPLIVRRLLGQVIKSLEGSIVITKTARELLFDGYNDTLLDFASRLNLSSFNINIPFDKFGWFYNRNESETYDGIFNMYTGRNNLEQLGVIELWNHMPYTEYYEDYCNYINGTSGELWPPIDDANKVAIFSPDICSSLWLIYEENTTVLGVKGRKYVATNYTLDNGILYPEQACFNSGTTIPRGVRNVSQCKFGAPAFISFPHFYLADKSYRENITGMYPNKSAHEFYISLEPNTGIPLNVRAQMQINILLQPIKGIDLFQNVGTLFVPTLWFRQRALLTEKYGSLLKMLLKLPDVGIYSGYGVLGLGIFLFIIGCLYITLRKSGEEEDEILIAESSS